MLDQKQIDEMMEDISNHDGNVEFLAEEIQETTNNFEPLSLFDIFYKIWFGK